MPRPKFRREPCDCLDCAYPDAAAVPASSSHASAIMDPPPKCLILFGEGLLQQAGLRAISRGEPDPGSDGGPVSATGDPRGLVLGSGGLAQDHSMQTSLDAAVCPHLDALARDGCSGFVALRESPAGASLIP